MQGLQQQQQQQNDPLTLAQAPTPQVDYERKEQMKHAWKAYRGDFHPPLKVAAGQTDDNVLANRCAPIVDKGVSFLFGQDIKIEASDEATDADTESPIQDFIDGLWGDDDDRMVLLSRLAINGGVCGQAFLKLIPAQGQMKYPRIVVLDPLLIRIVTAPDDCELVLAYVIEYPGQGEWQKRQIIARVDPDGEAGVVGEFDLDDTWTITNYMRKGQLGSWLQIGAAEEWPYPFAPIFSCQNLPNPNEPWGKPDLTPDIIGQNKVLNFVQSNTSRIIKFHAHPKTYATGVDASQINIAVDDVICLPSPDSKLDSLEMHSDLASSLNFAEVLRSDMDEQSRIPAVALGRLESLPKGNLSGVALQLLFQPLIEKTTHKQRLYGCLIREITRASLVVAGQIDIEDYVGFKIGIHWQNLLPVDDLSAAQTALLFKQLGVSNTTLLQKLGFDPEDEVQKTVQETAQQAKLNKSQGMQPAQPPVPGQMPPGQAPPGQSAPPPSPFIGNGGQQQ